MSDERNWTVERAWTNVRARTAGEALESTTSRGAEHDSVRVYEGQPRPWPNDVVVAEGEDRVVTITLLESEWLTAVDALHDRAEQTQQLAGEVGEEGFDDPDLLRAAEDYERVARAIESHL